MGGRLGGGAGGVKSLSGLYLRNCKEVDTWYGHWLGAVGVQPHGVTLI